MKSEKKIMLLNLIILSTIAVSLVIYSMKVIYSHQQNTNPITSVTDNSIINPHAIENSKHIPISEEENSMLKSVRKISQDIRTGDAYNPCIIMVSQLHVEDAHQLDDLLTTIQMNLWNPFVCEYHFLQRDKRHNLAIRSLLQSKEKVKIRIIETELTIGQFMEYSNENLSYRLVMLSSGNVFFDHTLVHASKIRQDSIMTISMEKELTHVKVSV